MDLSASSPFEERLLRRLRDAEPAKTAARPSLRLESRAILFATGLLVGIAVTMLVTPPKISSRNARRDPWHPS